jgi:hypothetical protein
MLHWAWVFFGMSDGTGPHYLFWSGIGSDLGELTLIAGLVAVYRQHNCEVCRCWRLGRHKTAAEHRVCRRHHPHDKLTPQHVVAAHEEALKNP